MFDSTLFYKLFQLEGGLTREGFVTLSSFVLEDTWKKSVENHEGTMKPTTKRAMKGNHEGEP